MSRRVPGAQKHIWERSAGIPPQYIPISRRLTDRIYPNRNRVVIRTCVAGHPRGITTPTDKSPWRPMGTHGVPMGRQKVPTGLQKVPMGSPRGPHGAATPITITDAYWIKSICDLDAVRWGRFRDRSNRMRLAMSSRLQNRYVTS